MTVKSQVKVTTFFFFYLVITKGITLRPQPFEKDISIIYKIPYVEMSYDDDIAFSLVSVMDSVTYIGIRLC